MNHPHKILTGTVFDPQKFEVASSADIKFVTCRWKHVAVHPAYRLCGLSVNCELAIFSLFFLFQIFCDIFLMVVFTFFICAKVKVKSN